MRTVANFALHQGRRESDGPDNSNLGKRLVGYSALSIIVIGWLVVEQVAVFDFGFATEANQREVVIAALPAENLTRFGRWPISLNVGRIRGNSLESLTISSGNGKTVLASQVDVAVGSAFEFEVLGYHYEVGLSSIGASTPGNLVLFDGTRWRGE